MLLCTLHTVAWGNLVSPSQLGAGPMQGGALGPQAPPLLSPAFSLDGWRMDLVLDPNLTGTPCALSLFMELGLVPDYTAPPLRASPHAGTASGAMGLAGRPST